MRRSLRPAVILASALVVVVALAVAVAGSPADDANPSSRSAGRLGTLALYTWFDRLGLQVSRLTGSFAPVSADVLVEYDPTVDFSAADLDATTRFVEHGGELVLAFDAATVSTAAPLLQRLGVVIDTTIPAGTAVPAQPFDPAGRVGAVPFGPGFAFLEQQPLVPLLRENGQAVAGVVRAGAGRAFILASSQPLSNDGLRHDDAAYLVLTVLERAAGGRIAFDEVHHGEGAAAEGVGAIFGGPIGVAAGLTAALVLVVLALNGRRVGRPMAPESGALVPSMTTYVTAMAGLFALSRQRGGIARRYADDLKQFVAARTGIAAGLEDEAFQAAVTATGETRGPAIGAILFEARRLERGDPSEAALLRLAREVAAFEDAWPATAEWRA